MSSDVNNVKDVNNVHGCQTMLIMSTGVNNVKWTSTHVNNVNNLHKSQLMFMSNDVNNVN